MIRMNPPRRPMTTTGGRVLCAAAIFFAAIVATNDGAAAEPGPTAPSALSGFAAKFNPANWKLPSIGSMVMPQKNEQDRIIERKDSLVTEVTSTAKNSWNRTRSALNPMKLIPAGNKTPSKKKEPGFFSRLLSPPASPSSGGVNDFLKQDRVKP